MTSSVKTLNWDKLEERRKLDKAKLWFTLQNKLACLAINMCVITIPGFKITIPRFEIAKT